MARRKKEPRSVHREKIASTASVLFMDIRTKQRGNPQYGRIFQDSGNETDRKNCMCWYGTYKRVTKTNNQKN